MPRQRVTSYAVALTLGVAMPYLAAADAEQSGAETRAASQSGQSATLAGTVIDENGRPIADARVCVVRKTWPNDRYRQETFATRTDQDGRFEWKDFYPLGQRSALLVAICQDGYALRSTYRVNQEGKKLPPDEFQLAPAVPVTIVLSDDQGAPAKGIQVLASSRTAADGAEYLVYGQCVRQAPELVHKTDDSGRVTLRQFLPGDQARLSVFVDGQEQRLEFQVPEQGEVELALAAPDARPDRPLPAKPLPPPSPASVEWVARHSIELRSIDPAETEFGDLQPLKGLIGEARIVLLGEQSHGDGAAFLTKTRLIKFLHQEMGFDVLAFESGLYDCRRAWQAFRIARPPRDAAELGIFGIWTGSREVQPLLQYLGDQAATDRPLELAGFDDQLTARAAREHLVDDVRQVLSHLAADALDTAKRSTLVDSLALLARGEPLGDRREAFQAACTAAHQALRPPAGGNAPADRERAFWAQFFRSIRTYADHTEDRGTNAETVNLRDRQMAENLAWLANVQYPGRKLIVWAASRHNLFNPQIIRGPDGKLFYDGVTAMGHELRSLIDRDEMFSIGFTAWEGEAAPWFAAPRRIPPARTGSLEDICQRTGKDNLLLPLKNLGADGGWLAAPLESRPLGYSPMTADWTQVFDAMVFNRKMTPSTRAGQRE